MASRTPVSAATAATSETTPSPPHATRSCPFEAASLAMRAGASGAGDTSTSTPAALAARVNSPSSFRVRPRPAAGLTIAVHGTAPQRSGPPIALLRFGDRGRSGRDEAIDEHERETGDDQHNE